MSSIVRYLVNWYQSIMLWCNMFSQAMITAFFVWWVIYHQALNRPKNTPPSGENPFQTPISHGPISAPSSVENPLTTPTPTTAPLLFNFTPPSTEPATSTTCLLTPTQRDQLGRKNEQLERMNEKLQCEAQLAKRDENRQEADAAPTASLPTPIEHDEIKNELQLQQNWTKEQEHEFKKLKHELQLAKLDEKQKEEDIELKEEHQPNRNWPKQLGRKNAKLKRELQQAKLDRYRKGKQTKELEKKHMATIHDLQETIGQLNRVVSDQNAKIQALHAAKLAKDAQGQSGRDAAANAGANADFCSSRTKVDKVVLDTNARADLAQGEINSPWAQTCPQQADLTGHFDKLTNKRRKQGPEQCSNIRHVDLSHEAYVAKDKLLDEKKTSAAMGATQAANRIQDLEAHCLAKDEEAEKSRAEVAQVQEQLRRSQSRVQEVEAEVKWMKAHFDHLSNESQIQRDVEMSDHEEIQDIEMSDPYGGEDIVMVDSDEDLIHKSQVVVFHQEQPVQKQPALCYSDVSANHPQGQGISFDISLSAPTKRPGTFGISSQPADAKDLYRRRC